jgi:hypothetical protein
MRTVTNEAKRAARAAANRTNRLKKNMLAIDDDSYFRRHDLRVANDGGLTYRELHDITGMSLTIIGEQIAKARAEEAEGLGPTAAGERPEASKQALSA